MATDHHLTVATRTVEQTCTQFHRLAPADEHWIERSERAILDLGLCLARAGGAAVERTCRSDRCRTCLNGLDDLYHYVLFVTFSITRYF